MPAILPFFVIVCETREYPSGTRYSISGGTFSEADKFCIERVTRAIITILIINRFHLISPFLFQVTSGSWPVFQPVFPVEFQYRHYFIQEIP